MREILLSYSIIDISSILFFALKPMRDKIFIVLNIKLSLQCLPLALFNFRHRLSCLPSSSIMSIISGHFVLCRIQVSLPNVW